MYFEAELERKKYKIDVSESMHHWDVSMVIPNGERKSYRIAKSDYQTMDGAISLIFENSSYMVDVVGNGINYTVYSRGAFREIPIYNDESLLHESLKKDGVMGGGTQLNAGMPGKIVKVLAKPGQHLEPKDPILVMEAMKMENEIRATHAVTIKEIKVKAGDSVVSGQILVTYEV